MVPAEENEGRADNRVCPFFPVSLACSGRLCRSGRKDYLRNEGLGLDSQSE